MISKIKYKFNRLYNWFYAFVNSYFWLPCPVCGNNFGGHEKGGYKWPQGEMTCNKCSGNHGDYSILCPKIIYLDKNDYRIYK